MLAELQRLPLGQAPQIAWRGGEAAHSPLSRTVNADGTPETGLNHLEIPNRTELPAKSQPEVYLSYAWGNTSPNASEDDRKRQEVVERMCEMLNKEGWKVVRDRTALHYGDLISTFMKRIGQADHVIVVLSDKYLQSTYCMTELYAIYQRSVGEKEDFLGRVIPLTLQDARISTWRDRVEHAKYWQTEFQAMELNFKDVGEQDFKLYKAMQDWHNRVGDILAYVNDVLHPHGFEAIVKDDFAALRQMLQRPTGREPSTA